LSISGKYEHIFVLRFKIHYSLKPKQNNPITRFNGKRCCFRRSLYLPDDILQAININSLQDIIRQIQAPPKTTALPIKTGDRIILLRFETIVYFEAQDKYVFVFTADGQKHLTDQSLTSLEEKLPPQFHRIHKSHIINKEKIKEMHRHFNGRYLFVMDDKLNTRLTSGRTYYDPIRMEFGL